MENIEKNKGTVESVDRQVQGRRETYRTHRVGTVTCGLVLILYGVLFLLQTILSLLDYWVIFRLWPIILIFLGVEILLSCIGEKQEKQKFIYDFTSVLLIVAMLFLAMVMASFGMIVTTPVSY